MEQKKEIRYFLALLLLLNITITAAGDGASGGGGSDVPRFAYVVNQNDDTVSIYTVNAETGQLRHNGYVATGGGPSSVSVDPSGRFAYVANNHSHDVSAYTINPSTGALIEIDQNGGAAGTTAATGAGPWSVTVDPSGKFAYVASNVAGVWAYSIDATTGALTSVGGVRAGRNPRSVTVDPSGKFAYVANDGGGVSAYTINATSGALTQIDAIRGFFGIQNFPAGTRPQSVTVDPSGKFAYVANYGSGNISAYAINARTGALTSIGAAVAAGAFPTSVTVDPSGKFAYVANAGGGVSAYRIDATTGALTSVGAAVAAGTVPRSVTVDPSGKFVYVANVSSDNISTYSIDATTGALTALPTVAGRNGNLEMAMTKGTAAVTYTPKFAYVANWGSNDVSQYRIDARNGVLTRIGTDVAAGTNPSSVTVDPSGRFAYVANNFNGVGGNSVSAYTIDATTGALTPVDVDPVTPGAQNSFRAGTNPRSVTVDPSGRFVYVANWGSNDVSAYIINATNGALTVAGTVMTGIRPMSVTIDPTGRFAYVANDGPGGWAYTINATNGALTSIGTAEAGGASSVTIDPTGKFAYMANVVRGVSIYTIHTTTGALALFTGFTAGTNPSSVTVDPSGKFVYVANAGSANVSAYRIDASNGTLARIDADLGTRGIQNFPAGAQPSSVTVDPSGKFTYVTNFTSNTVGTYFINATTGVLTRIRVGEAAGSRPVSVITTGTIQ